MTNRAQPTDQKTSDWKKAWSGVAELIPLKKLRDRHLPDRIFRVLLKSAALLLVGLLGLMIVFLLIRSLPAIKQFGFRFIYSTDWDPVREVFGALPVIYGTLMSSILAMILAVPLSIGVALYLNEIATPRVAGIIGFLVEMLAAIPSVIYGLWGIFVLAPWLREVVQPKLAAWLGFLPFFQGPPYGVGMFASGIILAIMVTPTISSICREVFFAIPRNYREAAIALGATRWETIRIAVLKTAKTGILGAVILGLGRALGETMAVTMVIGNKANISLSLFEPAQTMASVIANEYAEATSDLHLAALSEVALLLFVVTFLVNLSARIMVWRASVKLGAK